MILAKNLLCEIETAINNTGMKMPVILSKEMMHNRLTFRNNNVDAVDDIDSKFTKIRFSEYLHGLEQVLKNRMGKQHHHIVKHPKRKQQPKRKIGLNNNTNVGAVLPRVNKPIVDDVYHFRENHINSSITPTKRYRNSFGPKPRNPFGPHKQGRNQRKQMRKGVASLRPNEINMFRNHRKNLSTKLTGETIITSTTTTVAPHT